MHRELKVGDKVGVLDVGLLQLMALMPDAPPNNVGFIKELNYGDSGNFLIEFPIGDESISEHSQVAPYARHEIVLLNEE